MPPPNRAFLDLLHDINCALGGGGDERMSLSAAARRAGQSRFQFHREFRRVAGETLKQYTLRLQLERAAARLIACDDDVLSIAIATGFASHEVFGRAFRRYFGVSPSQYRRRTPTQLSRAQRLRHLKLTQSIGPCVRFFHHPTYKNFQPRTAPTMATLSIIRKDIQSQHILYIRRRIAASELQKTLGECFGKLFSYCTKSGLPMAGWPLCRYVSTGQGLWTIEPAMPLSAKAPGEGEIQSGTLPGGPVAIGIHHGPYEQLPDTNASIERWIEANGYRAVGVTWEQYVTDPSQHPDPKDWRTEVYWPLEK